MQSFRPGSSRMRMWTYAAVVALSSTMVLGCDREPLTAPKASQQPRYYLTDSGYSLGDVEFRSRVAPLGAQREARCMDVQGARRDLTAPLGLWECLDAPQQTFRWNPTDSTIRVYEAEGGVLCVDGGADPQAGGPVYTWTCHGGPMQRWAPGGRDHVRLPAYPDRDLCLDVSNGSQDRGALLQLAPCVYVPVASGGYVRQEWDLLRVLSRDGDPTVEGMFASGRDFELRSAVADDRCMDVSAAGRSNDSRMAIWNCLTATQQTFRWDAPTGELHVYSDSGQTKCLDVLGGPPVINTDGTPVAIWDCLGAANQHWQPTATEVRVAGTTKCLTVADHSSNPGTRLIIWECTGNADQQWAARTVLYADQMTGDQPTPNDGSDHAGSGRARFSLSVATGRVCASVSVHYNAAAFGPATAAHIHPAPRGDGSPLEIATWSSGEPLVDGLNGPGASGAQCTDLARATVRRILDDPGDFYFNFHTLGNPIPNGGILRAQLTVRPSPAY